MTADNMARIIADEYGKTEPLPVQAKFNRKLEVALYTPTVGFQRIREHVAVCYADDHGLVALTGSADEEVEESKRYANLFAAAPELLEALKFCRSVMVANGIWELSEQIAYDKAAAAINKAEAATAPIIEATI